MCGFFVLCVLAAIAADEEPSYNGRLLSQWLGDVVLNARSTGPEPYGEAIRAMGTNAIPTLLKWISYERPISQQSADAPATDVHLGAVRNRPLTPAERAERSPNAFGSLGTTARPAIPELTRLARASSDPERAHRCAGALGCIGREAIPSLISLVTNSPPWTRWYAIGELECFASGQVAAQVVPALIRCLDDTNTYFPVHGEAERVLLTIGPALVVPALTNALQSDLARTRLRAAHCLLALEDVADPRLPAEVPSMVAALRAAMRDPDHQVRLIATNVLRQLGGWELVREQWVRRHGTNTLNGITPDFFTNAPPR